MNERSSLTVQGGQYLNRGLTFGPADTIGTNAPRLYTLSGPTINTLIPFGMELLLAPASSSLNPVASAKLNVSGMTPAIRLTTLLNNSCFNVNVNANETTGNLTTVDFQALDHTCIVI